MQLLPINVTFGGTWDMDKIIFKFIWKKKMFKNTHENYKNRRIIAPNLTVIEDFSPWKF